MKRIFTYLTIIVSLSLFMAGTSYAQQWANNGNHIYNTNVGNVGIGNGALWAPTEKLHVNTFAAGIASLMLESNYNAAPQRAIGYIRIKNTAGLGPMFNLVLRKNGPDHEMLQSCFDGAMWREFMYYNYTTRKYEVRNGIIDAEFQNTGKFLISSGGNTGIGILNPLEKLDVNGAIRFGNTVNNNAGTIKWDGTNFLGYNGAGWVQLDAAPVPATWLIIPNPVAPFNPQLYPAAPPASISNALPGMPNFGGWFHAVDAAAPGIYPHQLLLESITGGSPNVLDASLQYRISSVFNPPFMDYSEGIFGLDGTYKVCAGAVLTATAQSDNTTMLRAFPTGIIDLPNQSRVRAYQSPQNFGQLINPMLWTPVNFDMEVPLPCGYDEQNEFTPAANPFVAVPPEAAFFVASAAGYYQVNARVEFNLDYWQGGPVVVNQNSYVSIAIYLGAVVGAGAPYAQGNNLQIGYLSPQGPIVLLNNNAPNVSDVIFMLPGQVLSIWVYQTAITPLNLVSGLNKVYVSIHKVS